MIFSRSYKRTCSKKKEDEQKEDFHYDDAGINQNEKATIWKILSFRYLMKVGADAFLLVPAKR
ncbi:MAG: hypothetical protein ISR65_03305 [Bacteriovoracaceae bacterium]|nr:hypothetical protein [Bacteriovoracaceae bacterium]